MDHAQGPRCRKRNYFVRMGDSDARRSLQAVFCRAILILLGVLNRIGILLSVNELQGALRSHPSSRGDFLPTHSSGK